MPLKFFFIKSLMHRRKQKFENVKIISSPISIFLAGLGHATDKKRREEGYGETVKVFKNDV